MALASSPGSLPPPGPVAQVVAHPGSGMAGAPVLNADATVITVVANPGDSVVLPPSVQHTVKTLFNAGNNQAMIYAAPGEFINGGNSQSLWNGVGIILACFTPGFWSMFTQG